MSLLLTVLSWGTISLFVCEGADRDTILIEAESFSEKGGWKVDQQFMDQMGSPYLLAHGMGVPVEDAVTEVDLNGGLWHIWTRTYNWTSPWTSSKGPGGFRVVVGEKTLSAELGVTGNSWEWQYAGSVKVKGGLTEIRLRDLTGFDGRCDALMLSKDASAVLPEDISARKSLPLRAVSALSVALYGMFLAIIIPPARKDKVVAVLVAISFALSFACNYLPGISALSDGTRTILLTVLISSAAAVLFPVKQEADHE